MKLKNLALLSLIFLGSACAGLSTEDYAPNDAFEKFNRASYDLTDSVDRNALVPVAKGYQKLLPDAVRKGILNIFANLRSIDSVINGFLQAKPKAGSTDLARLVINSTLGIGGIFDVASKWNLRAQNEDFGQTLAVWGVRKTRYVYLPLLGPTTMRDLPSTLLHSYLPRLIIGSDYHFGYSVLDTVSTRASLLTATDVRDASALDPYAFTRDAYFQRRKFLIYDGRPPLDDLFDEFEEDEFLDEELGNEFNTGSAKPSGTSW